MTDYYLTLPDEQSESSLISLETNSILSSSSHFETVYCLSYTDVKDVTSNIINKIKEIELMCTMYEYTRFVYASIISRTPIMQHLKYALQKNRVVQQMSRGRLILALKHYFKEGPYYPVDDTNSIYGKEYRKAMVRLGNK